MQQTGLYSSCLTNQAFKFIEPHSLFTWTTNSQNIKLKNIFLKNIFFLFMILEREEGKVEREIEILMIETLISWLLQAGHGAHNPGMWP